MNSDINGSLNILMKYDNYKNIPMLVKKVRNKVNYEVREGTLGYKGYQEYPIRLKVV